MLYRSLHLVAQFSLLFVDLSAYKLRIMRPARYGKKLARRFEKMGGIYVKIGQLLSVRPDLISFPVAAELHPLLQQVQPVKFALLEKSIREELGDDYALHFQSIDPEPIGTGSIAQVHKAVLAGGEPVVIKVLKPGIKNYVDLDLRILAFFMKMGTYLPVIRQLPVKQLNLEIDTIMREQLNLLKEAENLSRFRQNFSTHDRVRIPGLHPGLCRPDFIVMDYLPIQSAPNYEDWHPTRRNEVARQALHVLYQMMFRDGFTHCDLHPGNFSITGGGDFILLDFGMVSTMNGESRSDFIQFFYFMSVGNGKKCAEIIEKTALAKTASFKREKLESEVCAFIEEYSKLPAQDFSVLSFTKKLIQTERQCGAKGATNFINNILAITFFEAQLKRVDPAIDFQKEAVRYVMANVPSLEA